MVSKVTFRLKNTIRNYNSQEIEFVSKEGAAISISISGNRCRLAVNGKSKEANEDTIVLIWEMFAWCDGYFYTPMYYEVDGERKSVKCLKPVAYRNTDKKWITSAISLCENKIQINSDVLNKYRNIRYMGRKEQSMNASLISSFFYIISKSYSKINLEHRLVLLMHVCDGVALNFYNGDPHNNSGNINIIMNMLNHKKYVEGAKLIGVSSSAARDALGYARTELTHYVFKPKSLGSYISKPDSEADNMANLYVFYVLQSALRVAVLEMLGVIIPFETKNYVMDEYLDWIKLERHLEEKCVIPRNVLKQMINKIQNYS